MGRHWQKGSCADTEVSQCSPVWETGTMRRGEKVEPSEALESQCSPVWETGTIIL